MKRNDKEKGNDSNNEDDNVNSNANESDSKDEDLQWTGSQTDHGSSMSGSSKRRQNRSKIVFLIIIF